MARDRRRHAKSQQAPEKPGRPATINCLLEDHPMLALSEEHLLTTDEAIAFLARFKIFTSRSGLDSKFKSGSLARVEGSGRVRILYRPPDLLNAFFKGEVQKCPSFSFGAKTPKANPPEISSSGVPSQDKAFMRALELATKKPQKSSV